MRKTRNRTDGDEVGPDRHDDGNRFGGAEGSQYSGGVDDEDIDFQFDQFLQPSSKLTLVSFRRAVIDAKILALDVAKVGEAVTERAFLALRLRSRRQAEVADPDQSV